MKWKKSSDFNECNNKKWNNWSEKIHLWTVLAFLSWAQILAWPWGTAKVIATLPSLGLECLKDATICQSYRSQYVCLNNVSFSHIDSIACMGIIQFPRGESVLAKLISKSCHFLKWSAKSSFNSTPFFVWLSFLHFAGWCHCNCNSRSKWKSPCLSHSFLLLLSTQRKFSGAWHLCICP